MKYYLISGEASGDLHGAHLIKALKKLDAQSEFRAWGGDLMNEAGANVVKHYKELAFMGFWEVISNLPTILINLKKCKKDIIRFQPDVIIYIDYPGFNLRIAKWSKSNGFLNHYYISPQVWAWKENRIKIMKQSLDALYVILPFEKKYFEEKHQFDVDYVGNPLINYVSKHTKNETFLQKNQLEGKPIIALLPGSRIQEISKMLPLFISVSKRFKEYQFVIAGAPGIDSIQYKPYLINSSLKIVKGFTYDLLQHSSLAIVTSGTATLETALFNVPQLVCYKTSKINYWIGKKIIKLSYISLVNLILNRFAITELIQQNCTVSNISKELNLLLDFKRQKEMRKAYLEIKSFLGNGEASVKTASMIYKRIRKN